jgi:hypothetical protein
MKTRITILALLLVLAYTLHPAAQSTFNGNVKANNGTLSAPSLSFASETTLGFYRFSSGVVGITSHLLPSADASYDVGSVPSNRFRGGWFSDSVEAATIYVGVSASTHLPTANTGALRSEYLIASGAYGGGMVGIVKADGSAFGDLRVKRISSGSNGGDPTFVTDYNDTTIWNLLDDSQSGAVPAMHFIGAHLNLITAYTANMTHSTMGMQAVLNVAGSHTYTGSETAGLYGAVYSDDSTGAITNYFGVVGDMEAGGTGAITNAFSFSGYCCSYDPAMGTASTITNSGYFYAPQPFVSSVPPVNHRAIWIDDQTSAGTFVPSTSNYAFLYTGAAANIGITANATLQMNERSSDAAAPAANNVVLYAKDTGGGKTTLCARFNTGAVQCFATEP